MITTAALILTLSLSSPAADVFADLPEVRLESYAVAGRTLAEVRRAIETRGPVAEDGRRFHGLTTWRYRFNYAQDGRGRCEPRTAVVSVEIAVTLPELARPELLDPRDRRSWDDYVARLALHEREHVRLVLRGRDQLEQTLRRSRSCADLAPTARRVSAAIEAENLDFDRRTGHGQRAPF